MRIIGRVKQSTWSVWNGAFIYDWFIKRDATSDLTLGAHKSDTSARHL